MWFIPLCCPQRLDFSGIEPDVKQFEEKFGKRVLVNCNDLSFNLQSCVAENEEGPTTNVRPGQEMQQSTPRTRLTLVGLATRPVISNHSVMVKKVYNVCTFLLQVEPFYVTLSLFDIQSGRKISSDFHVDLNHPSVRAMVPSNTSQYINGGGDTHPEGPRFVHGVPEAVLKYPRQASH